MSILERADIQGIIARGYGELKAACYVLLGVENGAAARRWLGTLADRITVAEKRPSGTALNLAFTHAGLEALGLDPHTRETFPAEFREGMTSPHRARFLGDGGESAAERWNWGGPSTPPVHLLLLLYASDEPALAAFCESLSRDFSTGGVRPIGEPLTAVLLREERTGCSKEHFGFCDAIAQPLIEGLGKDRASAQTIRAGEFLLGYPNEYGLLTERPMVEAERDRQGVLPVDSEGSGNHDLGRNGSYLVFRQLAQDVAGFWQFLKGATSDADGNGGSPEARIRLASKMVGRWPSGAPLVKAPEQDDPELRRDNDFGYHATDAHGLRCPLGAHIRRTNPRDSLDPEPGSARSLAINKRHQILRRGRAYGEPVADSVEIEDILRSVDTGDTRLSGERGLHFICFNANISRQFEFVQQTWINNPKFAGLYNDTDPLLGDRTPDQKGRSDIFTEPAVPVRRRITGLPRFVTVRGGAYFFLPGIRAIRYLASLEPESS